MSKHFFKNKIIAPGRKRRFLLTFVSFFLLTIIAIAVIGFVSPVVRSGLHRIAVLSRLSPDPARDTQKNAADMVFKDIPFNHPQAQIIAELKKRGLIKGHGDGSFRPESEINRAEIVEMLVASKGINPNTVNFSHCFKDVGQEWFARSVCYAKNKKWITGYQDGTFRPSLSMTITETDKLFPVFTGRSFTQLTQQKTDAAGNNSITGEENRNITRVEFALRIYNVFIRNL